MNKEKYSLSFLKYNALKYYKSLINNIPFVAINMQEKAWTRGILCQASRVRVLRLQFG